MRPEYGEHARAFLAAARDSHKAWAQTSMLARVRESRAHQVCSTLARADAAAVAKMISDMAGPAISSFALHSGVDTNAAMRLSELVMQMLTPACVRERDRLPQDSDSERALTVCMAMRERLLNWIDSGSCDDAAQLGQLDELIGHNAAIRLSLTATAAPVLAHCEFVARAVAQEYPFMKG